MSSRGGSGGGKIFSTEGRRTTASRRNCSDVKARITTGSRRNHGTVQIKNVKIKEAPYITKSDLYYDYRSDGKKIVRALPLNKIEFEKSKYDRVKKAISNNVKQLRKEKNLKCEDLARMSNITRQYIGQIEKGEKNITLEKLCDLATALNVNLEFLINESAFDIKEGYVRKAVEEIKKLPKRKQIDYCIRIIKELTEEKTNETI